MNSKRLERASVRMLVATICSLANQCRLADVRRMAPAARYT
jgi:hypothetical protein